MHLDGNHTLNAPLEKVWQMLLDPQILTAVTPGVKRLEPTGPDQYDAIFEIKMGPVSGSFNGRMEVLDRVEKESFRLKMDMRGKIGTVAAEGRLSLKSLGTAQTEVSFSGDSQLTGTLARTGQRVLSGVATTMTNQFFKALEKEIDTAMGIKRQKVGLWARIKRWFSRLFGKSAGEV